MIQMNLSTKQKQTHRQRRDLWSPKGRRVRDGWIGSLGLADANYCIENG